MTLLTHLQVKVTGVVGAPVDDVWRVVRVFGAVGEWLHPVEGLTSVESWLLPGTVEGQVGGMRAVSIGRNCYVEQLECLDEEARCIKWKLISHPANTNPFPATFLNFKSSIQLMEVTREQATFMAWTTDFDTDLEGVEIMRSEISARIETGFQGLSAMLAQKPQTVHSASSTGMHDPMSSSSAGTSPPKYKMDFMRHQMNARAMAGEFSDPAAHAAPERLPNAFAAAAAASAGPSHFPPGMQSLLPLGDEPPGGSFSFPSFAEAKPGGSPLPGFVDPAYLVAMSQRHAEAMERAPLGDETQAPLDAQAAYLRAQLAASQGAPARLGGGRQSNLTQLDQQDLEYLMAASHQAAAGQDPVRAYIQQGQAPGMNLPSLGSLGSQESMQSMRPGERPGGSLNSSSETAEPRRTPAHASPPHGSGRVGKPAERDPDY